MDSIGSRASKEFIHRADGSFSSQSPATLQADTIALLPHIFPRSTDSTCSRKSISVGGAVKLRG
jgi:hypothetical protein